MSRGTSTNTREDLLLRVTLHEADSAWRELTIDGGMPLAELRDAIVIAFGWLGERNGRFVRRNDRPTWGEEYGHGYGMTVQGLPTRFPRPSAWRGPYDGPDDEAGEHEWSIHQATSRFKDALCLDYACDSGERDERSGDCLHSQRITPLGSRLVPATSPRAMIVGGEGVVTRAGDEARYGELADPRDLALLRHEFASRFGDMADADPYASSSVSLDGAWPLLDRVLRGASLPARRALRMDLRRLGLADVSSVDMADAASITAPVGDVLRRAMQPDGVAIEDAGPIAEDVKALGLVRAVRGRLHTKAALRGLADQPDELWHTLCSRIARLGQPRYGSCVVDDIVWFAVRTAAADRPLRLAALEEAAAGGWPSWERGTRTNEALGFARATRLLGAMGLIDDDARPKHPAAQQFALDMLRS